MQSNNLNAKQQCFVSEYLIDLNGTQAAIRAGFDLSKADEVGAVMLHLPNVRAAIGAALVERGAKNMRNAQ